VRSAFGSLAARVVFFVFAATLITSLTVTAVSVNSIDSFLRGKVNQRFPSLLALSREQVAQWYEQREREMIVFAESEILGKNLADLGRQQSPARRERIRVEIEQYLSYIRSGFPQYSALFVLDPQHRPLLWVGERPNLPDGFLERLAPIETVQTSDVLHVGDDPLQLASVPLAAPDGSALGSLHALLRVSALAEIFDKQDLGSSGQLFLVDDDGITCAASQRDRVGSRFGGPLSSPSGDSGLREYTNEAGERVLGAAISLPRFLGWHLVVEQHYGEVFAPVVSAIGRVLIINLAIVVVVGIAAFRVAVSIVRPIEALSAAARRISDGERAVVVPEIEGTDEVAVLSRAFNDMTMRLTNNANELALSHAAIEEANDRLRLQNEELQRVNEVLEQLSITDGLTKLHNHRHFQEILLQESKRALRSGRPLSLILIDIDHFKGWNDRLGHAGGDEILRRMAEVMNGLIRETDLLARYGGEEFALVAPNTDCEGAALLAEKIRAAVASTQFLLTPPSERDVVTVSIGVAEFGGDRRALFNDADRALYRAKEAGRDCVFVAGQDE